VSEGQSGQLLPCGQWSEELLEDILLLLALLGGSEEDELEGMLLGRAELLLILLLMRLLLTLLDIDALQTAPVTVGRCAGLLMTPLLPCTPNSTVCPGLIRSFQPTPVAV
jgi:hypothetical protein